MNDQQLQTLCEVDPSNFRSVLGGGYIWTPTGKMLDLSNKQSRDSCALWMLAQLPDVALCSPHGQWRFWMCDDTNLERYAGKGMTPSYAITQAYLMFKSGKPEKEEIKCVGCDRVFSTAQGLGQHFRHGCKGKTK